MNRKQRRAQAAKNRKMPAALLMKIPDTVRLSTAIRGLKHKGQHEAIRIIEECRQNAAKCEVHGELTDPLVFICTPEQAAQMQAAGVARHDAVPHEGEPLLVFGCPWCSTPDLLAKWESEGEVN